MGANKDTIILYITGAIAILCGIEIIILGELGTGFGDSLYKFNGVKRLYGLYPISIGAAFIYAAKIKNKDEEDKQDDR